ncbi:MAG: caspase family protein [Kiritimatiellae bacterium]|nr:caspase family protein [Kiritimatiellia bacterium]
MGAAAAALAVALLCLGPGCKRETEPAKTRGWVREQHRGKHLTWTPPGSVEALAPRYHAVVIGINAYRRNGTAGWEPLATARGDAESVATVLEQQYGFTVTRLLDKAATRNAIMAGLDELVALGANDAALVYFAGHGYYDKALDEGYWVPCDARKTDGTRLAKEDWLWNSTITKIIGASKARHVFVIADSCYSGSLFRGGTETPSETDLHWYKRAMAKPSRFLLTSGDIEPVLDSGHGHSVFAQEILNYLQYPEHSIFAASDLGTAVRRKVSTLTGQMVRIGPLAVAAHAGGEFVFVRKDAALPAGDAEPAQRPGGRTRAVEQPAPAPAVPAPAPEPEPATQPAPTRTRRQSLQDASLLGQQGAPHAAQRVLAELPAGTAEDGLVRAVSAYLDGERRAEADRTLRTLIARLEERKSKQPAENAYAGYARPRILACLGPQERGGGTENAALALLYRICLRAELERRPGLLVVEREAIEKILQELNIGASDLADPRAQAELGKLLPASVLVLGDLLPGKTGEQVFLRLVDTETTRVLASFAEEPRDEQQTAAVCEKLANAVALAVQKAKPLTAQILSEETGVLQAGVGHFHGATEGMTFALVQRAAPDPEQGGAVRERQIGRARLVTLGEETSELRVEGQSEAELKTDGSVWIRELVP